MKASRYFLLYKGLSYNKGFLVVWRSLHYLLSQISPYSMHGSSRICWTSTFENECCQILGPFTSALVRPVYIFFNYAMSAFLIYHIDWLIDLARNKVTQRSLRKLAWHFIKTYEGWKSRQEEQMHSIRMPLNFLGSKASDGIMTRYQILAFVWAFLLCVFSQDFVSDSIHCHTAGMWQERRLLA